MDVEIDEVVDNVKVVDNTPSISEKTLHDIVEKVVQALADLKKHPEEDNEFDDRGTDEGPSFNLWRATAGGTAGPSSGGEAPTTHHGSPGDEGTIGDYHEVPYGVLVGSTEGDGAVPDVGLGDSNSGESAPQLKPGKGSGSKGPTGGGMRSADESGWGLLNNPRAIGTAGDRGGPEAVIAQALLQLAEALRR
jgi:hypothetical protein